MKSRKNSATTTQKIERVVRHSRPSEGLTRLQPNMIIRLNDGEYLVEMVNDCRARCSPLQKVKVQRTMFDKRSGANKEVEFERTGTSINISPNSECDIIRYATR